jgi:hypothetical protein
VGLGCRRQARKTIGAPCNHRQGQALRFPPVLKQLEPVAIAPAACRLRFTPDVISAGSRDRGRGNGTC